MTTLIGRRTGMVLYADPVDIVSHQFRLMIAEKQIPVEIIETHRHTTNNTAINELNPEGTLPIFIEKQLVIYSEPVITTFLDERFPHPPLLPSYPIERANAQMLAHRLKKEWYELYAQLFVLVEIDANGINTAPDYFQHPGLKSLKANQIEVLQKKEAETKTNLLKSLITCTELFSQKAYFMSENFSVLDCVVAPLLWRLPLVGITLPNSAKDIIHYRDRLFERPSFLQSLSELEKDFVKGVAAYQL
jgi:RNA polymerase-associated protein